MQKEQKLHAVFEQTLVFCDGWIALSLYKLSLKWPLLWMGSLPIGLKFRVILSRFESWICTVQTPGYGTAGISSLHLHKSAATFFRIRGQEQCFLIEAGVNSLWRHLLLLALINERNDSSYENVFFVPSSGKFVNSRFLISVQMMN